MRGRSAIDAWRRKHPDGRLDIRGADLRGIKLAGANLFQARLDAARPDERPTSLRDAVLTRARLRQANLRMADLSGADLRGADFRGSQLSIVNFSHADLRDANLGSTILIATNFHRGKLEKLDLTNSIVGHTLFTATDLSHVTGLSTLRHDSPSTIDVETLFSSAQALSNSFLQGCGVPDVLITNLRSLVSAMEPIQFNSCFISYSSADELFANPLHSRLREAGVPVWFAPEDVRGGDKLYDQIDRAIQTHDRLLLVLSEHSMKSQWVSTEIRRALAAESAEKRRKLFPIRLCGMDSLRAWACFDADSGKDMASAITQNRPLIIT